MLPIKTDIFPCQRSRRNGHCVILVLLFFLLQIPLGQQAIIILQLVSFFLALSKRASQAMKILRRFSRLYKIFTFIYFQKLLLDYCLHVLGTL